jgi:hypothetical protein
MSSSVSASLLLASSFFMCPQLSFGLYSLGTFKHVMYALKLAGYQVARLPVPPFSPFSSP